MDIGKRYALFWKWGDHPFCARVRRQRYYNAANSQAPNKLTPTAHGETGDEKREEPCSLNLPKLELRLAKEQSAFIPLLLMAGTECFLGLFFLSPP